MQNALGLTLKISLKLVRPGASLLIACTVKAILQTVKFNLGAILFTTDMARYTHYFDVCVSNSFDSDIEDFGKALDKWLGDLGTTENKRREILSTDESTSSLMRGIVYADTLENESTDTLENES